MRPGTGNRPLASATGLRECYDSRGSFQLPGKELVIKSDRGGLLDFRMGAKWASKRPGNPGASAVNAPPQRTTVTSLAAQLNGPVHAAIGLSRSNGCLPRFSFCSPAPLNRSCPGYALPGQSDPSGTNG
jgi:hypothetical protein